MNAELEKRFLCVGVAKVGSCEYRGARGHQNCPLERVCATLGHAELSQWFSNSVYRNYLEGLLTPRFLGPTCIVSESVGLGEARECALLTSSQVILLWLGQDHTLRSTEQRYGGSDCPGESWPPHPSNVSHSILFFCVR